MNIDSAVIEREEIRKELKRLNAVLKSLRTRRNELDEFINEGLNAMNRKSYKCGKVVVRRKKSNVMKRKKKGQKEADCISVLKRKGIRHPERVCKELMKAMSGNKEVVWKVT